MPLSIREPLSGAPTEGRRQPLGRVEPVEVSGRSKVSVPWLHVLSN